MPLQSLQDDNSQILREMSRFSANAHNINRPQWNRPIDHNGIEHSHQQRNVSSLDKGDQ